MVLRMVAGVALPDSRITRRIERRFRDSPRVRRAGAPLPDSRRGRRGGVTLPDSHQARRAERLCLIFVGGRRAGAALPGSRGVGCIEATGAPFTTVGIGMRCFPFSFLIAVPAVRWRTLFHLEDCKN